MCIYHLRQFPHRSTVSHFVLLFEPSPIDDNTLSLPIIPLSSVSCFSLFYILHKYCNCASYDMSFPFFLCSRIAHYDHSIGSIPISAIKIFSLGFSTVIDSLGLKLIKYHCVLLFLLPISTSSFCIPSIPNFSLTFNTPILKTHKYQSLLSAPHLSSTSSIQAPPIQSQALYNHVL